MKIWLLIFIIFYKILDLNAQQKDTLTLEEFNQIRLTNLGASASFWDSVPWYNYVGKDVLFLINYLDNFITQAEIQRNATGWISMAPSFNGVIGYTLKLNNSTWVTIKFNTINYLNYELGQLPASLSQEDFEKFKLETIYEIQISGKQLNQFCRFTPHGIFLR